MLAETDELAELFKCYFPYYIVVLLPLFIIISPVSPVSASHEFPAYRMTQFDLNGVAHGCRSSQINLEARALHHSSTQRHCVISKLSRISLADLSRLKQNVGGLLLVLPQDFDSLTFEEKESLRELETSLLEDELSVPVYLTPWSSQIETVLNDIESSELGDDKKGSSFDALVNAVSANGYQVVINAHKPSPKTDASVTSIQSKLSGYGVEDKLPTIAVVTYYDSFGIAPELSSGGDSNASGIVMLLELVRIFSNLFSHVRSHGQFNLLFLLSGGGKFNYQGSKKWLEDQLDGLEGSLLQDTVFVLCLDSVGFSDNMYLHVSKPPKEGTIAHKFYQELKSVSNDAVSLLHKKINLADEVFAWEHERYSMRRLPAFTLSSIKNFKDPMRRTSFDSKTSVNMSQLCNNIDVVASALTRIIYNSSGGEDNPVTIPTAVECEMAKSWFDYLTSQSRSAILLGEKNNPLLKVLHDYMNKYLKGTKFSFNYADKRDPEFIFYDTTKAIVNLYNVKPAVFDLFISILILCYLLLFYVVVNNFDLIYSFFSPSVEKKIKNH